MSIWRQQPDIDALNRFDTGTLGEHLGMRFVAVHDDGLSAKLPVDDRTRQPYGILHGGATAALAEQVGSTAGSFCIDIKREVPVGITLVCNHLKSVREGEIIARARALHLGRRTQVWNIDVSDQRKRLIASARLTLAVIERETG